MNVIDSSDKNDESENDDEKILVQIIDYSDRFLYKAMK